MGGMGGMGGQAGVPPTRGVQQRGVGIVVAAIVRGVAPPPPFLRTRMMANSSKRTRPSPSLSTALYIARS